MGMTPLIKNNIPFFLLILAVILAFVIKGNRSRGEMLTRYFILLPVGVGALWICYLHLFEPIQAALYWGWPDSPFQIDVGMANLGIGVAGVWGFWKGKEFIQAVIVVVSGFLWGLALHHIGEILFFSPYPPVNTVSILIGTLILPMALWFGYHLWGREEERP